MVINSNFCYALLVHFLLTGGNLFAISNVGKVVLLKGSAVNIKSDTTKVELRINSSVDEGDKIQTGEKSFVRIIMTDKSTISIGPESHLEIKKMNSNGPGLISLVKGTLRAQVTKTSSSNEENKMYIKTGSAALGIRGTDFTVISSKDSKRTSVITFEGDVRFSRMDHLKYSMRDLESVLKSVDAVAVRRGEFAGVVKELGSATLPVKISPVQLSLLRNNTSFEHSTQKAKFDEVKSIIPNALDSKIAASESDIIKSTNISTDDTLSPPPEGQIRDDGKIAPPSGGYIDTKTGLYIPPPSGATYDANTNTFIVPKNIGTCNEITGEYVPPKGMMISENGEMVSTSNPEKILYKLDPLKPLSPFKPTSGGPLIPSLGKPQVDPEKPLPLPCNDPCFCGPGTVEECGGISALNPESLIPKPPPPITKIDIVINLTP